MARTSEAAGRMEMETVISMQRHIANVRKECTNEILEAWLRGTVSAYTTALAELIGPKEAFEIFSQLADREMLLSHPDNK